MNATDAKLAGVETLEQEQAKTAKTLWRLECKEQSTFAGLLKHRKARGELIYGWAGTHKATTNLPGTPDFWVSVNNRLLQIEFKMPGGKLSEDQKDWKSHSQAAGTDYHIVYTADQANDLLVKWLKTI